MATKNQKFPNAVSYNANPVSEGDSRVSLTIASVIVDNEAGASLVDNIWGQDINGDFIVSRLQGNASLRESTAEMLMNGTMGRVFQNVIEGRTFRTGGIQATISEVFDACKSVSDNDIAALLCEFSIPLLVSNGMVSDNVKYAVRRKVPYSTVTVEAIAQDLLRQELSSAISQARQRFVLPSGQHSTQAVSELFADALRPVGVALMMINNYENVLHDITLGVLANIDPAPLTTQLGSVPEDLRNHNVVQQLVSCWTFITAALTLRSDVTGLIGPTNGGIATKTQQYTFDKHAPVVLAMLRSSQRFSMVSKSHFVGSVGFKKVLDLKGRPVSTVLYDNAQSEAIAMAVIKVEDAMMEKAICLQDLPDRVSERMMSAYNDLPQWLSVSKAAEALHDVIMYKVEAGEEIEPMYSCRMTNVADVMDIRTLAAMFSERVSASYMTNAKEIVGAGYELVFSGSTVHQSIELKSGKIIAGTYITTDPVEVFLCLDNTDATRQFDVPAQLIPRSAMQSRLLGYDQEDFVSAAARGGYAVKIMGVELTGTIRLKELTSIRMGSLAALVTPYHNSQVYKEVAETVTTAFNTAQSIKEPVSRRRAMKTVAQYAIRLAQSIAPSFRSEIHQAMIEQAAKTMSYDDSVLLRAKLKQQGMMAAADIIAASVFFKVQGISPSANFFDDLTKDQVVVDHWMEFGSDRDR